jgi:prepilin-type N-terminal cleavage/methylation domain-containing protein/prepilin-type processing-associated H-X9-DG protein
MMDAAERTKSAGGFTLVEVLVVIGIIGLLMAMLLPALEVAREHANTAKCATNLRSIGQALALYTNENHGVFPRTAYVKGAPPIAGTNPAAADPFTAGGPGANDVSAAIFLLMRAEKVPPAIFICPYNDVNQWEPEPNPRWMSRSNFTDYRHNLGYSYANPYPDANAERAGYRLNSSTSASFPVFADMNPGTGGSDNSRNHEGRGQNVLYADGHVWWSTNPFAGLPAAASAGTPADSIYTKRNGAVNASPVDAADCVLLPTQE